MNEVSKKVIDLSALLIDSFFEFLDEGQMSNATFQLECQKEEVFKNVKRFWNSDYSCITAEIISKDNFISISVVELVLEKFNDYLLKYGLDTLSDKLSDFDEEVSDDSFLRTIEKIPPNDDVMYEWFNLIWKYTFERVSSYEKTVSFSVSLHQHSLSELNTNYANLSDSINSASQTVNHLEAQVNGENGNLGLVNKLNDLEKQSQSIKDDIQKSTVTILGIFASIILAFSGALSFSTSVLQSMYAVSIYRLIGIVALVGIVFFNIILCLAIYLLKGTKSFENGFSALRYYSPLWVTDIILTIILILTFTAWKFNWLSNEIPRINDTEQSSFCSTSPSTNNTIVSTIDSAENVSENE